MEKKQAQRVITKDKRVPANVIVGMPPDVAFQPGRKLLKDSIQVIVTNGQHTHSWTIHKPIGITTLERGDWVMSPSEDIPDLLNRTKDDDAARINQVRAKYRLELAIARGIFFQDTEGNITYDLGYKHKRDEFVNAARIRADEHNKLELSSYKKANPKGKDPPVGKPYTDFMKPAYAEHEKAYADFVNQDLIKNKVLEKYPHHFETAAGAKRDRKQVSATHDGVFPSAAQAMDGLIYQIDNMVVAGFTDVKTKYETGHWAEQVQGHGRISEDEQSSYEDDGDEEEELPPTPPPTGGVVVNPPTKPEQPNPPS